MVIYLMFIFVNDKVTDTIERIKDCRSEDTSAIFSLICCMIMSGTPLFLQTGFPILSINVHWLYKIIHNSLLPYPSVPAMRSISWG